MSRLVPLPNISLEHFNELINQAYILGLDNGRRADPIDQKATANKLNAIREELRQYVIISPAYSTNQQWPTSIGAPVR